MDLGTERLISLIIGPAGALILMIVLGWLWLTDRLRSGKSVDAVIADKDRQLEAKDREISEWKAAYAVERQRGDANAARADAAILAAQASREVLAALHREVSG